jgi:hypothetical protein
MNINLVVVRPFGPHARGAVITDAATIASILASEHATYIVRVKAETPEKGS